MAQRPWEVLRETELTLQEARQFLIKSEGGEVGQKLERSIYKCVNDSKLNDVLSSGGQRLFKRYHCRGLAQVMPLHLQYVDVGIKTFLRNFNMSFVPELGGVWIACRKARLVEPKGFTSDAEKLGIVCFQLVVEVLVFCPQPGLNLTAQVTEIRHDGLSCSIFGCFNGHIALNRLLEGSKPIINEEDESLNIIEIKNPVTGKAQTMKLGSKIKFVVYNIVCFASADQETYTVEGSMRPLKIRKR
ncbi:hypothetical protein GNI_115650 [Gregarina niphandrodes]|uniref:Uncharacterized protein n=1 Tax=Gregarina niphandrodes TaxID=110365 RepID=A0A023B2Z0_GRENI|nr:hypothetical protein GNI_115650 [Gregarina niphandrodes]EZG55237.1 hypothetical protein GNI_115650 [Gregarina niphandrodes]|eukprot:XP_011131688.1 hypothetical protein GNI_115650 [Gregarina niphandrodes]